MQAEVMQHADPAEFAPEVLDADVAFESHQILAERAESVEIGERTGL
jgi:hypothetical protein